MSPRNTSFVKPRVSLADLNYNHKSDLASLRAALYIYSTTILADGIVEATTDDGDVIQYAQGLYQVNRKF
jgi:hypothetical protein